jgi:site-specific recombinase XerD
VVEEYLSEVRPRYEFEGLTAMWPTERGGCVADANVSKMFAALREEAELPPELGPHCLRHSYVTHLIEDGFDPLFVQQQVGHSWASTTALYTGVSSDYKNTALRQVLDRRLEG